MAKLKQDGKINRVIRFLLSFSRKEVVALMAQRGFTSEDREEGFQLLDKAVGRDLALGSFTPSDTPDAELIRELDTWENVWFDVADAALARSFPEIHAKVLDKLNKTTGQMVLVNVKVFLDRLNALEASEEPEDAAALALLAKRGLDHKQRQLAAELVDEARSGAPEPDEGDAVEQQEADLDEAVAAMWAWYLDWAKTARTVVKSKRMRIVMGLSSASRSSTEDEGEDEGEIEGELDEDEGEDDSEAA